MLVPFGLSQPLMMMMRCRTAGRWPGATCNVADWCLALCVGETTFFEFQHRRLLTYFGFCGFWQCADTQNNIIFFIRYLGILTGNVLAFFSCFFVAHMQISQVQSIQCQPSHFLQYLWCPSTNCQSYIAYITTSFKVLSGNKEGRFLVKEAKE